jgi:Flp pilus assembly protein TadD
MPRRSARRKSKANQKQSSPRSPRRSRPRISRRRLWLFRVCALCLPLVAFLVAETGLRFFGYRNPSGFVMECEVSGKSGYCDNPLFTRLFFPREIARVQRPFRLPKTKLGNTYRIIIFGSSAAMGDPAPAFGFGRILERLLRHLYPELKVEVVNAAITGINSHVVHRIVKDCGALDADLYIVYEGNNEVIGPYGAGTVFAGLSRSIRHIRTDIRLKSLRTVQELQRLKKKLLRDDQDIWKWGLEMFQHQRVPADSPDLGIVYKHFRRNLLDICRLAEQRGIRVILSTVPVNLKDCPPFASLHGADLGAAELNKWESHYGRGVELQENGDIENALIQFRLAEQVDDRFAELHFRMGECLSRRGDWDEADAHYRLACDLDALRIRTDSTQNKIIREVAASAGRGVNLLDAERILQTEGQRPSAGREMFYDHVHLNFQGNYLLARAMLDPVSMIISEATKMEPTRPPFDEPECARRLALNSWNRYQIHLDMQRRFQKPPFSFQAHHDQRMVESARLLREYSSADGPDGLKEAAMIYEQAIADAPEDCELRTNYAKLLLKGRQLNTAAEQCRYVQRKLPHDTNVSIILGHVYFLQERYALAERQFRAVLDQSPGNPTVYNNLAKTLLRQDKLKPALKYYRKAAAARPGWADARHNVAFVLSRLGRYDEALEHYTAVVQLDPNSTHARLNLGDMLMKLGRSIEAAHQYREALRIDPDFGPARERLSLTVYERLPVSD